MSLTEGCIKKLFPPIYNQTSISFLKSCHGFLRARSGDMQAAQSVITQCVKPNKIVEIRKKYPNATLLPLIEKNKLPQAFAQRIGLIINNKLYFSFCHKKIVAKITKGSQYILVDDIFCSGGRLSELYAYVINHGGLVSAVATLAFSDKDFLMSNYMQNMTNKIEFLFEDSTKFNVA